MAGERRAEADEVATAQLVERAQQMVLICERAFVFCDDGGPRPMNMSTTNTLWHYDDVSGGLLIISA